MAGWAKKSGRKASKKSSTEDDAPVVAVLGHPNVLDLWKRLDAAGLSKHIRLFHPSAITWGSITPPAPATAAPCSAECRSILERFGEDGGRAHILLAFLSPELSAHQLLATVQNVKNAYPDSKVIVVGEQKDFLPPPLRPLVDEAIGSAVNGVALAAAIGQLSGLHDIVAART